MARNINNLIKYISLLALVFFTCQYVLTVFASLFSDRVNLGPYSDLGITDALEYWSAYRIWASGGNPYSSSEIFKLQQTLINLSEPIIMWNPPWTMLVLSPILKVQDFFNFAIYWGVLSILVYIVSSLLLINTFAKKFRFSPELWIILLSSPSLLCVLYWGQISAWLLLGLSLALYGIQRQKWLACTAGWILMSFKFHLFLALVPLLIIFCLNYRSQCSYLVKSCSAFLAIIALFCLFNQQLFREWLVYTLGLKTPEYGTASREWVTCTIPSLIRQFFGLEFNYSILTISLILVSFWISKWLLSKYNLPTAVMLILCWSLPCGAFAWFYDYVCLMPALVLIWPLIATNRHLPYFLAFSFICLAFYSRTTGTALNNMFIIAPLTIYTGILLLRSRKLAQ